VIRDVLAAICGLSAGLTLLASSTAKAQEPDIFEVVVPIEVIGLEIPGAGFTLGEAILQVTAYADGQECASVETAGAETDVVIRLGAPGQAEVCSRDGAIVTFVDGFCHRLATEMILRPGTQATLDNLAPVPPGTTEPVEGCLQPTPTPLPPDSTPTPQPPPGGIQPPDTGDAGLIRR